MARVTAYYYQLLGISINLKLVSFPNYPIRGKLEERECPIG